VSNDTTTLAPIEHPASVSIKYLYDGYDCLLTLKGSSGGDVLKAQAKAVEWLTEHGAGPTAQKIGYPATPTNGHAAPAPSGAATGDGGVTYTARYVVQPEIKGGKPTGKTILEFWNDDRKFSEHRVVASPARVTALIGLPEADQGALATFEQPCKVVWTWGKERPPKEDGSPGGRYQDVQRVELIAPA